MTKNEKIQKIVDRLLNGTENGSVIWNETDSIFNSSTRKKYSCTTEDGKTEFTLDIHLDDKLQPINNWCYVYMYNQDLTDGKIQMSYTDYPELLSLQMSIYNKWMKQTIPVKNDSIVLDEIIGKIGDKQSRRDRILDEILGEQITPSKETPKVQIEESSFLKKLFKRL